MFALFGCGGGGERDPYGDLSCANLPTNPHLFDISDYESRRISSGDRLSAYQWHLNNFKQKTGAGKNDYSSSAIKEGADINVKPAWDSGYSGNNVVIAIVDNGTDITHPDLAPNYDANLSWNYMTNQSAPYPVATTVKCAHGTATAGIAAAKGGNDGAIGVAPNAKIAALNLSWDCGDPDQILDADVADALSTAGTRTRGNPPIDVFSNSWGCRSPVGCLDQTSEDKIIEGANSGRGGKGAIYLFAAGNDRAANFRSDYAPHLSLFEVLPIAALDAEDNYAYYSNPGANLLVSAYGGYGDGEKPGIMTTDIVGCNTGFNGGYFMPHQRNNFGGFTARMNGTSAATPMAAGAAALMLEANPNLTWREVRYILATTARKNDTSDSDWKQNGANPKLWVNHNYGFGAIDVFKAVQKASGFAPFGMLWEEGFASLMNTNKINFTAPSIRLIEYTSVNVKFNAIAANCRFDLKLTSPSGTHALFVKNDFDAPSPMLLMLTSGGYEFGTPRFLDEDPNGEWTLTTENPTPCSVAPSVKQWTIIVKGRS
jgi:kexin